MWVGWINYQNFKKIQIGLKKSNQIAKIEKKEREREKVEIVI